MPRGTSIAVQERITACLEEQTCKLVSFEKGRIVRYVCSCGNETKSDTSNVSKPAWKGCAKCSNQKRGNIQSYEFAKKVFADGGVDLPEQKYTGNKQKLHYECPFCKEEALVSLSEFKRGRRCQNCPKERAKVTNIEKYGVENPFQAEVCKKKGRETCLKKYGQEHHMQNPEISEKALHKTMAGKTYVWPSGVETHCQGYEPRCFDLLLETYDENDILTARTAMPVIWYDSTTRKGKKSIYYADAYLPKQNIVVEVKSSYTLDLEKDKANNKAKFIATAKAGYELHLYVFDDKKLLFREIYKMEDGKVIRLWHPAVLADIVFED